MPSNDNKKSIVGVETNRSNSENDSEQRIDDRQDKKLISLTINDIEPDISSLVSIINKFTNDDNKKSSATTSSIKLRTTKDSGQMLKEGETKREKLENESKNNLEKRVGNYIKNKHDKKLISQKINGLKSDIPISNLRIDKFSIDNDERSSATSIINKFPIDNNEKSSATRKMLNKLFRHQKAKLQNKSEKDLGKRTATSINKLDSTKDPRKMFEKLKTVIIQRQQAIDSKTIILSNNENSVVRVKTRRKLQSN
ncbi:hypothetical protein HCN44_000676 [Aphidius gifuensis]|uniref:Uncharacterized protein n=1 Tax=Aphidius gifuensis TaxID=684658 RepID=A0A834XU70_APHGI|nr:hypothetical protein HCN44_000676 [Aphidius gifuensis]